MEFRYVTMVAASIIQPLQKFVICVRYTILSSSKFEKEFTNLQK